jgi:hypothetical protein
MTAILKNHNNKSLFNYINQEWFQTSSFDKKLKHYTYATKDEGTQHCKGLNKFLKQSFYNTHRITKRRFGKSKSYKKKASSKSIGKRVDKEISSIIMMKKSTKKSLHPLTEAIVKYWEKNNLTPICSQLFVKIPKTPRMTQADVIVKDNKTGDLIMHEIKTGYVGVGIEKGKFTFPFNKFKCTKGNIWDLQRHFTEVALRENGLDIKTSYVIHAYIDGDQAKCIQRKRVFEPKK